VGSEMESGPDSLPPAPKRRGKAVVDHQKTSSQAVSSRPLSLPGSVDWREVFNRHPELSPPGYEEASAQVTALKVTTN
jgi:hypothetical protein